MTFLSFIKPHWGNNLGLTGILENMNKDKRDFSIPKVVFWFLYC